MKHREDRYLRLSACELRAVEDDDAPKFAGYAARYGVKSDDLFFGIEVMQPGLFKRSLGRKENEVVATWNHSEMHPLARRSAGNLAIEEDEHGLRVEITPDDTSYARDLAVSIRSGTVQSMSVGFRTITDEWRIEDGVPIRDLIEAQLFDVAPVTTPAYPQTDIAVRSLLANEGAEAADILKFSGMMGEIRSGALTPQEFRSIFDPFVAELHERRGGPGPESHPSREATESRQKKLQDLQREGIERLAAT